jgi:hypothetical protein
MRTRQRPWPDVTLATFHTVVPQTKSESRVLRLVNQGIPGLMDHPGL